MAIYCITCSVDISGAEIRWHKLKPNSPSTFQFRSDVEVKLNLLESEMKREIALIRSKL